ncbi:MAG: TIGR03545 family protein [Oleispira sp.]|nr:TIGR03545 family protein [Oleispira sp.]
MKQWIRWSGLVGFIVILSLVVFGWMFAAGPLIKYSIETFGSQAAGAKVEVGEVNLSFNPLGVEILNVQVANADAPMENLVEFERALADLELMPLLLGKGIINNLSLTGVEFSTERLTSGALDNEAELAKALVEAEEAKENEKPAEKGLVDQGLASLQQSLPTADELLAREPLLTEQRGKAFQQQFKQSQQAINKSMAAIPNDQALAHYEDEFERIVNGRFASIDDFNQRKKDFDQLKKRIKSDKKAIQAAAKVVTSAKTELQQQWPKLQAAPLEDFENLKSKYQLDGAGVGNLSRLLFGEQAGQWSQQALYWYEKAKPFLISEDGDVNSGEDSEIAIDEQRRKSGRYVHFPSERPLPDFLIIKTELNVTLALGEIAIRIDDITHQQHVINRPTVITASGKKLQGIDALNFNGILDHRVKPSLDRFDLSINNIALKNYNLGAMGLKLNHSQVDVVASAELSDGTINAQGNAVFNASKFSSKDKTIMAKETVAALDKVNSFKIDAGATGKLQQPKLSFSSDLEDQLSSAFSKRLKEKQNELEKKLKEKLNDKLLSYAGDYQQQLKALDLASGSFASKQAKLQQLANSELSSFKEQQQEEADKRIAEERRKAEDKATEKAKKQQKEWEKKAKDKFKNLF